MDAEIDVSSIENTSTQGDANSEQDKTAFDAQWRSPDTTHLAPSNLAIARARRAWERKASSPLNRDRLKVGKVWKRTNAPVRKMRFAKLGADSPLRAVKRLRVDGDNAEGSKWEVRGEESPVRKIVTRSARQDCGLVELEEEEEEEEEVEEEGEVTVEVFDEDGNAVEVDGEDAEGAEAGWSDVEEELQGEPFDGTMMHLTEAVGHAEQPLKPMEDPLGEHLKAPAQHTAEPDVPEDDMQQEQNDRDADTAAEEARKMEEAGAEPSLTPGPLQTRQVVALPEGFVTPMKQRRKLGPRSLRAVSTARRQTLPVQFAPSLISDQPSTETGHEAMTDAAEDPAMDLPAHDSQSDEVIEEHASAVSHNDDAAATDEEADGDWEDVADDEATVVPSTEGVVDVDAVEGSRNTPPTVNAHPSVTTSTLLSSPVPTIEGPHPRLPLRRSPRRQSTSPLKHDTFLRNDKPHFLAFTPIKRPLSSNPLPDSSAASPRSRQTDGVDMATSERASSAPPEEPQSTPRSRSTRPRISDDTALLQAFLNRAEQNKSSRRLSATEKEALTNRRDSDTVRQALASPAALKPDVLTDLDPNSPVPRKAPAADDKDTAPAEKAPVGDQPANQDEDDDSSKTTRSGRRRKKPQVFSQSAYEKNPATAPSKITIRGTGANGVDLKRTEAQELAMLTKNNTRKNKSGCVLPRARLLKLEGERKKGAGNVKMEGGAENLEMNDEVDDGTRRRVRWAEILSTYRDDPELSDHSDEPQERMPWERGADFDPTLPDDGVPAPPPPADTPSKPRVRRLRAPKATAASAPAGGVDAAGMEDRSSAQAGDTGSVEEKTKKSAAAKPRKSRLATPAKVSAAKPPPVLLTSDLKSEPEAPPAVAQTATTKKRSRLPAPSTKINAGKENDTQPLGLISSPPKKRPASGLSGTKSFPAAPKLDFAPQLKLSSSEGGGGGVGEKEANLNSPPKKRVARTMMGTGGERKEVGMVGELGMGMKSPAKKRGRRLG